MRTVSVALVPAGMTTLRMMRFSLVDANRW